MAAQQEAATELTVYDQSQSACQSAVNDMKELGYTCSEVQEFGGISGGYVSYCSKKKTEEEPT